MLNHRFKKKAINSAIAGALLSLGASSTSAAEYGVMMQFFHWYLPADSTLWTEVAQKAPELSEAGIDALWLPPSYKGQAGVNDVGYGVYDIFDMGEFDQKGTIPTKYGSRAQYDAAISAAHANNIQIYGDVVLNHMGGADATEMVQAVRVNWDNRNIEEGSDLTIEAWTKFDFAGRGGAYNNFTWNWTHFDGVDWNQATSENRIFKFRGDGKDWDWEVTSERGNYDYLMFADVDFNHPTVVDHLKDWGEWYVNDFNIDGFRIDAIKHIKYDFFSDWLNHVRAATGKELFAVGEFWDRDVNDLHHYITATGGVMSLFDAPLHYNFADASNGNGNYDMRTLMDNTLMKDNPSKAVTLVDNLDTQPCQALASPVQDWFKPLAYAFILLREEGYPNVFYADYYGATYDDCGSITLQSHKTAIDKLLKVRKDYAYGTQHAYMDNWDIIGFSREGNAQHPESLAVIMSDGPGGTKWMYTGRPNTTYTDQLGNQSGTVTTNADGWGEFRVGGGSVSAWVGSETTPGQWERTVIFVLGPSVDGQDMFVRGGIDHGYAAANLGKNCTSSNFECAIPIRHNNLRNATTSGWKANENYLDWYGSEPGQSSAAEGAPADWTIDVWPSNWGTTRTVAVDGFGEEPLNRWGRDYWMLDVEMDCSATVNGWFELKTFISNGPGWEADVSQPGTPYSSGNHFAECGKLNVFERGVSNPVTIEPL